jgi:hypothetical protein
MNDDLAPLVNCDFPRSPLGVGLRRMDRGDPSVPCAAHGPIVTARNNMLVLACHNQLLILDPIRKS